MWKTPAPVPPPGRIRQTAGQAVASASSPATHVQLTFLNMLQTGGIGLGAGLLGGLAGVGGSMVMLPALHLVFGDRPDSIHHLYMAAAMTVNIAVSLPAASRHRRQGAVRSDLLPTLLISTGAAIVLGVLVGNLIRGDRLKLILAGFIGVYCLFNLVRLIRNPPEHPPEHERTGTGMLVLSGGLTGFAGGLLGLGGGVLLVPMLQMACRVPLRQSIATSSAVICLTAIVGAGLKLASLPGLGQSPWAALALALAMAPTAVLGGHLGAHLTHALPLRLVRAIVTLLLMVAASRLAWP